MSTTLRLGLFIVFTLLIFVAAVFLVGRNRFLFTSTYHLRSEFKNVAGLSPGAGVRVGGLHKGSVERIDLPQTPDGTVKVLLSMEQATRAVIKKDSTAVIKTEGLLGDKYVEVSFGSPEAEAVNDQDTIAGQASMDMSDLMVKSDRILDDARDAMENVVDVTGNLRSITSKVDLGKGTAGALINDRTMYQQATAGAAAFSDNMQALHHNFLLRGFFRKRGYEDSTELTKHDIPKLPSEAPLKRFSYDGKKLFDGQDTARLKHEKSLDDVGGFLEANPFGVAVVVASLSLKGDAEKHKVLSKARAMVVRDYLARNFRMDDSKLKTLGLGETRDTPDGGKVEVLVYPSSRK